MLTLPQLRLLQLADSALPVGALAHSFGLETLSAEGFLTVERLETFLADVLAEAGTMEAAFCRAAHRLRAPGDAWLELNLRIGALKPARESRAASAALGRRFLQFVCDMGEWPMLREALDIARRERVDTHHAAAFGLAGATLDLDEETAAAAYLHQTLAGLVSACQRLLPLGQTEAGRMSWRLKPALLVAVRRSGEKEMDEIGCFTALVDWGAMRHPWLGTRLFIS